MTFTSILRQHWAALRALLVLTVVLGLGYPLLIWLVAQLPGLKHHADGSLITAAGKPVGSGLIGQQFVDGDGQPLRQYFQGRPSAAGDGYDPLSSGASNLGPESIVDGPDNPSLLTQVCSRSKAIAEFEGVDGARPFCTGAGVGSVLSVIGPRDSTGGVSRPEKVVSLNEPCRSVVRPFLDMYDGVPVTCATVGEDYSSGQIVPIRGAGPADPAVPADAVTASGSGLDPNISVRYAELQAPRVAAARGVSVTAIRQLVTEHIDARVLGVLGEPRINVVRLNLDLDQKHPLNR